MSMSTIPHILQRIASAVPASPIAVFNRPGALKLGVQQFDALFAYTVRTKPQLDHPDCLGVFHREMKQSRIMKYLQGVE